MSGSSSICAQFWVSIWFLGTFPRFKRLVTYARFIGTVLFGVSIFPFGSVLGSGDRSQKAEKVSGPRDMLKRGIFEAEKITHEQGSVVFLLVSYILLGGAREHRDNVSVLPI